MNPPKRWVEIHGKDFTATTTTINGPRPASYTRWSIENLNTHKQWTFMPSEPNRRKPCIGGLKVPICFQEKSCRDKIVNVLCTLRTRLTIDRPRAQWSTLELCTTL